MTRFEPCVQERLRSGLPFPVHCCWNGLVVFNAAPFARHGLRFRAHQPDECAASECSLMCDDFKRLGYSTALVDPGVRQAYVLDIAREVYNPARVLNVSVTTWHDVEAAQLVDWAAVAPRPSVECCFLQPGADQVQFWRDCKVVSPFERNFTEAYLSAGAADDAAAKDGTSGER